MRNGISCYDLASLVQYPCCYHGVADARYTSLSPGNIISVIVHDQLDRLTS